VSLGSSTAGIMKCLARVFQLCDIHFSEIWNYGVHERVQNVSLNLWKDYLWQS